MRRRTFLLLSCLLGLSSCTAPGTGRYGYETGSGSPTLLGQGSALGQLSSGARPIVAILVPLTGPRADVGQILVQAAQLALSQEGSPALDVLDTSGTPRGAAAAAQSAASHGDGLILGPLTSAETTTVTAVAQGARIPVLAFTNDSSKAQPGVWPLGITPGQQVRRLVAAAQTQGKSRISALLPDNDFGRAMAGELTAAVAAAGLQPPVIRTHGQGMTSLTAATRDVADYANRRGPIDTKIKAARELGTPEGRREAQELARTPIPPPPFDTLLLADTGDTLEEIVQLLRYYDIDRGSVQIIGPALWADPTTGSLAVEGAWYAAPDSNARAAFVQSYSAKYGAPPPSVADLSYDAASVARVVLGQRGRDMNILSLPSGFVGSDGWFNLQPDGKVQRGLAVFKIEHGGPELIDPAPQAAGSAGL